MLTHSDFDLSTIYDTAYRANPTRITTGRRFVYATVHPQDTVMAFKQAAYRQRAHVYENQIQYPDGTIMVAVKSAASTDRRES